MKNFILGLYFTSVGYPNTLLVHSPDKNGESYDAYIKNSMVSVVEYWHGGGAHYIAVVWDEKKQQFTIYNDDVSSVPSIDGWLKDNNYSGWNVTSVFKTYTLLKNQK